MFFSADVVLLVLESPTPCTCVHVYFCTNLGKVLDFKVHEGKIWHKYPHVIHLSLCVTTIYCLNYFADGLR